MDLYVLRHGVADERSGRKYPDDGLRPLTDRGIRRMTRQVRGWNALGLPLEVIITSPLVRAAQTADIVHRGLREPCQLITSEHLAPGGDASLLMDSVAQQHGSANGVMIVGHEPYLSCLVSLLATGDPEPCIRLKKGALCKLRLPSPGFGRRGWIEWSLTPAHMVRLGKFSVKVRKV